MESILLELGAKDEADGLAILRAVNKHLSACAELLGKPDHAAQIEAIRALLATSKDLESQTGKPAAEGLGVVLAWKEAASQLPALQEQNVALQAQVTAAAEDGRKRDVEALFVQARADKKITPALEALLKDEPVAKVKAYIDAAHPFHDPSIAPPQTTHEGGPPTSSSDTPPADLTGKRYEDIAPTDRLKIEESNPEAFAELRNDWIKRGRPAKK